MKTRSIAGRTGVLVLSASMLCTLLMAAPAGAACVGDCDASGSVTINELILGVGIALGSQDISKCEAFDCQNDQTVPINCLIQGVNNDLNGCPPPATETQGPPPTSTGAPPATSTEAPPPTSTQAPPPTSTQVPATSTQVPATSTEVPVTSTEVPPATSTPEAASPTPTVTSTAHCPLAAGEYKVTQMSGGSLQTYTFAPFPFPAGGSIVEEVQEALLPDCVHQVVIPFPGGFNAPHFCVPALGLTTSVTQTGCGIGRIDSNGGSDFKTTEIADTSNTNGTCSALGPQSPLCSGTGSTSTDSHVRVDITVGDGSPDTCASGGTANALISVPVHTVSWSDNSPGTFGACPGNGEFDQGVDQVAAEFDQILDFTTDTATGKWMDLDGDGCYLAGFGPATGFTGTGKCIDFDAMTVTTVAVGEFGASGGLFDGSFLSKLPNVITGPEPLMAATCPSGTPGDVGPPAINFSGSLTRCIH